MILAQQANALAYVEHYEELRSYAVQQQSLVSRLGLAVLLQQGVAAWVEQWSKMPAPTETFHTEAPRPSMMETDATGGVINILAAMALGHMEERYA